LSNTCFAFLITIVVAVIPVVIMMPAVLMFIPPLLALSPATLASFVQLMAPVVRLVAVVAMAFDSLVKFVICAGSASLAIVRVGRRAIHGHKQEHCTQSDRS
jgi:hypothetical protein